jgi:hypothetical protein
MQARGRGNAIECKEMQDVNQGRLPTDEPGSPDVNGKVANENSAISNSLN